MIINDYLITLEYALEPSILNDDEPSRFLYETHGKIVGIGKDDEQAVIGKFEVYYVNVDGAGAANVSIHDVMDSTATTFDYFETMFDIKTEDLGPELCRLFKDEMCYGNILILDRLEILPAYRRQGIGLAVMRQLIEQFGIGATLVAIKPFPLQGEPDRGPDETWRNSLELATLGSDFNKCSTKLRRHYGKLGFKRLKSTEYMFLMQ